MRQSPWRKIQEKSVELALLAAASCSVFATIGIVAILIIESVPFFEHVSLWDFLTDSQWTPLFADAHFGIMPLLCGTLLTTGVALLVAVPMGTAIAVFLSEYASAKFRDIVKPMLELLSAVPTVVYGYFALLFVTPILQKILSDLPGFSVLSAGIVMGVMIIPYVSSLSEDALRAVPSLVREGALALGATKFQAAFRVVLPSAASGLTAAYILAISRAVGETMVVSIAAGMQPNLTYSILEPVETITAYIVQVSLGDLPHGSLGYQTIFVAGLTLLLLTLFFNIIGHLLRRRYVRG